MMSNKFKKILLIGFSVTADFNIGYVPRLQTKIQEAHGSVLDVVGIGGLHPNCLIYLIDDLVRGDYDRVILEISTSSFRKLSRSDGDLIWPIIYIMDRLAQLGIPASMIHLPRKDVDFFNDRYASMCDDFIASRGVSIYNIGKEVQQAGLVDRFIVDDVHVNESGAQYYADRIFDIVDHELNEGRTPISPVVFTGPEFCHVGFDKIGIGNQVESGDFHRTGFDVRYVDLRAGSTSIFLPDLPEFSEIQGFSYVTGPWACGLEMLFKHSGRRKTYQLADEFSYYERFNMRLTSVELMGELSVLVSSERPDVKLKKGSLSEGERRARLAGLCCGKHPILQVKQAVELTLLGCLAD